MESDCYYSCQAALTYNQMKVIKILATYSLGGDIFLYKHLTTGHSPISYIVKLLLTYKIIKYRTIRIEKSNFPPFHVTYSTLGVALLSTEGPPHLKVAHGGPQMALVLLMYFWYIDNENITLVDSSEFAW